MMTIEQRAEELASDLGVDYEEVKHDLDNLVAYSVPIEEAVQSLRRKYGDGRGGDGPPTPSDRSIGEISTADSSVSVTARVLTEGKRSIRYQGADHVITEGVLADESGTIDYTAWEPVEFEPGDTVTIANASVREWDGEPELNLGDQTTITRESTELSVPYEVGGERSLDAVTPGDRGLTIEVRILEVDRRTIDGRDGETEILSGVLADRTARLPFTDWTPREVVAEDASLRMENVYVREFRGVPSINLSEFTTVESTSSPVETADRAPRKPIDEAVAAGGTFDVELTGTIVAIRDGSGLIQRCPECNRVIQRGECRSHGTVEGIDDLRVKAILDDGTGTVTAVLGTDLAADIYGGGVQEAREHAREAMDQDVVTEAVRERLAGRAFRARGSLSVDDFGANLEVTEFEPVTSPPGERADELLEEVTE